MGAVGSSLHTQELCPLGCRLGFFRDARSPAGLMLMRWGGNGDKTPQSPQLQQLGEGFELPMSIWG